ncbi:SagB/ThcOx family dehydrogenase [Cryptosporangium aurantiacum]|uniref:SagB-type dehydrogenase domain-containing protein n=1 Tax=Cryptosporangium aurantiacum TaxID=134849 RepID=A0A1M7RGN7_9ACTN|nr:SagB/ThcOx family dehydrogenase [Cryptosporangium aurantiacum]SHN45400.1 SagB-type dehydrogenase domain-containing protein [Cryptosporangium aurantiacum]
MTEKLHAPPPGRRVVPGIGAGTSRPLVPDVAWEIFHENSKTGELRGMLPDHVVVAQMEALEEQLTYRGYPRFELPRRTPLDDVSVQTAIDRRESARTMTDTVLTIDDLSTLLHAAYGLREHQPEGDFPRRFRSVPSGGALYPLELYVHASDVLGLPVGLFHYEPLTHSVRLLRDEPRSAFRSTLVAPEVVDHAAVTIFLTAIFYRSTFKYGERGYRFVLLEAGHVGQNVDLTAAALGYAALNIGGYFDDAVDAYLGLDGLRHSTVYLVAVGGRGGS